MSESTPEGAIPASDQATNPERATPPENDGNSRVREYLTKKATALATAAAIAIAPSTVAIEDQDPDSDGMPGVTTTRVDGVAERFPADYKRSYGDGPPPEGSLTEVVDDLGIAVRLGGFAREVRYRMGDHGKLTQITVAAQSSGEAHSEALKAGENPDTSDAHVQVGNTKNQIELSSDRRQRGMSLVSTVVRQYLEDNGINLPKIVEGDLREHIWTDEQVARVKEIAKKEGYESVFWVTEAVNTSTDHLSPTDKAFIDNLLRDQRYVELTAEIQTEDTDLPVPPVLWKENAVIQTEDTDLPVPPVLWKENAVMPAYWLAPVKGREAFDAPPPLQAQHKTPVARHQVQPRNHNYSKNSNVANSTPRGKLGRAKGGDRRGKRA